MTMFVGTAHGVFSDYVLNVIKGETSMTVICQKSVFSSVDTKDGTINTLAMYGNDEVAPATIIGSPLFIQYFEKQSDADIFAKNARNILRLVDIAKKIKGEE